MSKKKEKIYFKRIMHYFWQALMQYKFRCFCFLFLSAIYVFVMYILLPRGTSNIIGMLSAGDFEITNYVPVLMWTLIPTVFNNLFVIRVLDWLDWSLDAKCGEYLSKLAFDAVINQSMTFHSNHFSGSLTSAANKLPNAFINFKSNFGWNVFPLILKLVYALVVALLICPPFAGILLVFVIIYTTIATLIYLKTGHFEKEMADAENGQTGQLADAVTNVMSVKSYAREAHEKARFARATAKTKKATFGVAKASLIRNFSLNAAGTITFVVVLILIIMSHNLFGLTIANMIFLYSLSDTVLSNIWELNHILRSINRSFGDANEMVKILDMPYIVDDKTDKPLVIKDGKIEFDHISFTHSGKRDELFQDFCLTVPAGKSIGLVGISGSGKSTLTKLLLRFADVDKGTIFIDGQDIRDVTQKSLREKIAYVPQESSLFHRSIYENIAYGRPDATRQEVEKAAELAHADEFIKNLPDGYDTLVGERGVKLSGGQRQRIAIARAILKNAPILVLDEATSSLDSESEALIQKALANLMDNRTSIVVAHRLSTIAGLDKIVVLKDGVIVEEGAHKELLKNGREYAKLWSRQSGGMLNL